MGSFSDPSQPGPATGRVELVDFQRRAVVANQEDQGVLFQGRSDAGRPRYHQPPSSTADNIAKACRLRLGHLAGESIKVLLRGIQRHVGRAIGKIKEERFRRDAV